MITINYTKTIYILTDPDNDSIYDCENDSYLIFPSCDIHNDWWCFYKNDRLILNRIKMQLSMLS